MIFLLFCWIRMRWNTCMTLTKELAILTHSSWAFHECFACVLPSFKYHFNSLSLISLIWSSLSLFYSLAFCANQLSEFCRNWTVWLPHDSGYGCGESRNRLLTVLYSFFFGLFVLYFYIAPWRVVFQYLSCKLLRWYLLILIVLLTCI